MKVSAIVPVFNEEKTVKNVVETLLKSTSVQEVVCVNDGSTDSSQKVLEKFGNRIIFIDYKRNYGKGSALASGVKRASGDVVLFLDADLKGLTTKHVEDMTTPLLTKKTDVVLGILPLRLGGIYDKGTKSNPIWQITGQRAYYRQDLLPHLQELRKSRYGVETALNRLFKKKKIKKVSLENLKDMRKYEKYGPQLGFKRELEMITDMVNELSKKSISAAKDLEFLQKIRKATTVNELEKIVAKIKNKSIKELVQEYIVDPLKLNV